MVLVKKLMDMPPFDRFQRNNQAGWDWNDGSLRYSTSSATRFGQDSIPPQSSAILEEHGRWKLV